MENNITLRDQLAMSYDTDSLPKLENQAAINEVCKMYDLELDQDDAKSVISFAMKYEAIMRYVYADAMLEARDK